MQSELIAAIRAFVNSRHQGSEVTLSYANKHIYAPAHTHTGIWQTNYVRAYVSVMIGQHIRCKVMGTNHTHTHTHRVSDLNDPNKVRTRLLLTTDCLCVL